MMKYIIFGIGKNYKRYERVFDGIINYVTVFIDTYKRGEYKGKLVTSLEKINVYSSDYTYVISSEIMFEEMYNQLLSYGIPKSQIIGIKEWLAIVVLEKDVYISPTSARLESSTICQLNCTDCFMRKNDYCRLGKGYLTFENFKQFCLLNPKVNRIELSNSGEPLLNPYLEQILKYAYENGIEINFENGTNFNDVTDEVIESIVKYRVKKINCSIDGYTQEVYEKYRRKGNIEKVYTNIEKLNVAKAKYKSNYPVLNWQYILMEHNQDEVKSAIEKSKDLGMTISFKLDWNESFEPQNKDEMEKLTGLSSFNRDEWNGKNQNEYLNEICEGLYVMPQVNYDGRLLGCCSNSMHPMNENAFQNSLIDILNTEKYKKMVSWVLSYKKGIIAENTPCYYCKRNRCLANTKLV